MSIVDNITRFRELSILPAVVATAVSEIQNSTGTKVSVLSKAKSLVKFGRNSSLGAVKQTVWKVGGMETYPTSNSIDIVTSTSASDTQEVVIEGHTLTDGVLIFVSQTATLNGIADVTLATPLYRANRLYNNNSVDFVGDITVEDNGTSVNLKAVAGGNQSLKCATSTSNTDYWIITGLIASVDRQQSRSVDFEVQVRKQGKVFRTVLTTASHSNGGASNITLVPALIIPPNSDVRVVAISSGSGTQVDAVLSGYLAEVV